VGRRTCTNNKVIPWTTQLRVSACYFGSQPAFMSVFIVVHCVQEKRKWAPWLPPPCAVLEKCTWIE